MNNRKLLAILLTILTVLIGVIFVLTLLLRFNNEQPTSDNNDALLDMISCVLEGKVDYDYNKEISLFCNLIIDKKK